MNEFKEILIRIVKSACAVTLDEHDHLIGNLNDHERSQKLSRAIGEELEVEITPVEIESSRSLVELADVVSERLATNPNGRTLVDIYRILGQLIEDHLSHAINYHWHATWIGDLLHESDSLDDVEIVMSIEQKFGFSIPDPDAQTLQTVGQTVRYLWRRSCEQSFVPRPKPPTACEKAFLFYEVRRLLVARGGVARNDVHLDTRLGDLLPTWSAQFWNETERIFRAKLPSSQIPILGAWFKKRTTVRELVNHLRQGSERYKIATRFLP